MLISSLIKKAKGLIGTQVFYNDSLTTIDIESVFDNYVSHDFTQMNLSEKDKKEIIKLALEKAIVHKEIPDYGLIKDKKNIFILKENIKSEWIPEFNNVKFYLLSYDEIEKKADKEGDFMYLKISDFKIKNKKVYVSINNIWAMSDESKLKGIFYLSGGGMMLEFKEIEGKWNCKIIAKWIQ